jgi:hypothetical protein
VVSGTIAVAGWALTPGATCTIDGSGVWMGVDTGPLTPVGYGQPRADVEARFPGFTTSDQAGGAVTLDTTTLSDGMHQISWSVTDTCGRQSWIGSRFVSVHNAGAGNTSPALIPAISALAPINWDPIVVQTRSETSRLVYPNAEGVRSVHISQGDHLGVQLPTIGGATYAGLQLINGESRALPLGSTLQTDTAQFAWAPAASFLGKYELVFVATTGNGASQVVRVRVIVGPSVRLQIDQRSTDVSMAQPFELTGWAIDLAATVGTGIDAVDVWATPIGGGPSIRLGSAATVEPRPDVSAIYGAQFGMAGFRILVDRLPAGTYDVQISIKAANGAAFLSAQRVRVAVR